MEHAFPSIRILTANGTGNRLVVGFLMAFLVIGTAELCSADVTDIGLRRLEVGFNFSRACSIIGLCTKDQRPIRDHQSNSPAKKPRMYSPQSSNSPFVEPNVSGRLNYVPLMLQI
jgi:hypothetical protein